MKNFKFNRLIIVLVLIMSFLTASGFDRGYASPPRPELGNLQELIAKTQNSGTVRVIVRLHSPHLGIAEVQKATLDKVRNLQLRPVLAYIVALL